MMSLTGADTDHPVRLTSYHATSAPRENRCPEPLSGHESRYQPERDHPGRLRTAQRPTVQLTVSAAAPPHAPNRTLISQRQIPALPVDTITDQAYFCEQIMLCNNTIRWLGVFGGQVSLRNVMYKPAPEFDLIA